MQEVKAMTLEEQIKQLQEENARLKANKATGGSIKVSPKGAISIYGLGRFPVTLFRSQMEALLARADEIKVFINANETLLASKAVAAKAEVV
jgi:5-bromo-4-chloroindolyl phosphate hydrolysis protein